ncbi:MAG: hypothetical protein U5S82_20000 [Gammaproteobacteria bacterium]|nr:hypothetical protein [Gammaproteobacteria bacterium]
MSAIPKPYLEIIEPLMGAARGFLEQGESLVPFAFVGTLSTQQVHPVKMDATSEACKDASAREIRALAHTYAADFVFVIMEAWSLPPKKAARIDDILDRYGSIGASC